MRQYWLARANAWLETIDLRLKNELSITDALISLDDTWRFALGPNVRTGTPEGMPIAVHYSPKVQPLNREGSSLPLRGASR